MGWGEAFNPHVLLKPGNLRIAGHLDQGAELAAKMLTVTDPDELADLIEYAAGAKERAHAALFHLVLRLRNPDQMVGTGVEMVAQTYEG